MLSLKQQSCLTEQVVAGCGREGQVTEININTTQRLRVLDL